MLENQRHRFEMPDEVAYLNCGYMSPLPREVVAAGQRGLEAKARPWQLSPPDFFTGTERLRATFAQVLGAAADDIAVIPAVSYGMAVAANNLELSRGQKVLVAEDQFPSHVYPWRERCQQTGAELVTIARPTEATWTEAVLEAIDDEVAVVALPEVHWTDGARFDLEAIGSRARAQGAALVLDLTQSLGTAPFDLEKVAPAFVAVASYKWLFGPYGVGFLYASKRHHQGRPIEHNWINRAGAEDFRRLVDYQDAFAPGARRYDVGERTNFALVPAAEAGLRLVLEWGPAAIEATLGQLTLEVAERLASLGFEAPTLDERGAHYLGLTRPAGLPPDLLPRLAAEGVFVSVRGDRMRVTPHVYNQSSDVDRLVTALKGALG